MQTVITMAHTSSSNLTAEFVDALTIIVDNLLTTRVFPVCTTYEMGELWEHHQDITVRIIVLFL